MVSEEYSKRIVADMDLADALDDEEEEGHGGEGPGNNTLVTNLGLITHQSHSFLQTLYA